MGEERNEKNICACEARNNNPGMLLPVVALISAFLLIVALPVFTADAPEGRNGAKTVPGQMKSMGNGTIWSWVEYGPGGTPAAIGVTFTETALSGLPETTPPGGHSIDYELELPKRAGVAPYNHVVVNWNPAGHVPPGVYDVPHFDFHFYMITPEERGRITVKKEDMARHARKPPAKFIPAGYILPDGTQEPRMGSHWIDPDGPEFHNQPFRKTFIYGSYDGHVTFYEPMISLAYLREHRGNAAEPIKLPASFEKPGHYPVAYAVKHDAVRKEYTVSLEGLTKR